MTDPSLPISEIDTPEAAQPAAASRTDTPFFRPGENCWRVEHARRFRMLVDGEEYFTALRKAIVQARQTVFILGWDIDSRMKLVPAGANDGFPEPLAEFLHAVVDARPHLRVYVLSWDFAMLYAFEREWLPVFKMGWRAHRRFAFKQDGRHPIGGSHHQKIVLIDDRLAFVGGLDLTRSRWDTRAHAAQQPLRRDPSGQPYPPFHDIQVMFDGAAAAALGELVRERWLRANGRRVAVLTAPMRASQHDPWPADVDVDIDNVSLALCRTEPEFAGRPAVQEIRQMYLDGVNRARRHIFCENQYFTSGIIGEAFHRRLSEKDGPEVVILSRRVEGGWLQEVTMGVLRARLHRDLKAADAGVADIALPVDAAATAVDIPVATAAAAAAAAGAPAPVDRAAEAPLAKVRVAENLSDPIGQSRQPGNRYRMYCPQVPGLGKDCVNVHSKVMFVDNDLLFVGSANLNNRSMVLDTECNVALDGAADERVRRAIAGMRDRLLAEHLGTSEVQVAQSLEQTGSLIATIETLRGGPRTMAPHDPTVTPDVDRLVPSEAVIDPETPIAAEELVTQFVQEERHRPVSGRYAMLGIVALLIAGLTALWHWTPLAHYLSVSALTNLTERLAALPFSPVIIVSAYMLGGLISVPITLMIAATGIAFGAVEGGLYAFTGTMASATLTYWVGRWLGRDTVRRLGGARINGLSERLAERGLVAMVVLRVLPVAPFTVVNVIAGASQIGMRDYLLGTLIGMGPGIVITVTFAHQLAQAIRHPTIGSFAVLAIIGFALVALSVLLQRFFKSREKRKKPPRVNPQPAPYARS